MSEPDPTILVVEDDPGVRDALERALGFEGYAVETARDGAVALSMLRDNTYDVILLDVMIPKISGFEVCRRLKADPATRDIAIVLVTALSDTGDHERGVECGTDDFITKPVNRIELVTRVKSLLRLRHLKRDLDNTMAALDRLDPPGTS